MSKIKIGLFGFGVVGQGLHDILNKSKGFKAEVVKICVKTKTKKRTLPENYFTFDKNDLLANPDINLIVELIDDAEEAYKIVTTALKNGKNVVTANKKMVANHLEELVQLQQKHNVSLLYEASSCGSIPIIRNLEEYYDNELLNSVSGIFNGSTNYILSKIFNENMSYPVVLKQAQELGFVETDPTLDVGGFDPKFKLVIIAAHSFGIFINPDDVLNIGIQNLTDFDFQYAREKGYKIKLVATAKKIDEKNITVFVIPQFIKPSGHLYNVENEYNAVIVEAAFSDTQFFLGKGAGGHPTGMAVLSDISALRYNYRYEYKRHLQHQELAYSTNIDLEIYLRYSNENLLNKLGFKSITERFSGVNDNYVIGVISLTNLIKNKSLLQSENAFVVNTGRVVNPKSSNEEKRTEKNLTETVKLVQ